MRPRRKVGVPLYLRVVLASIINSMLGYVTQNRPSLTIKVDNIAQGKHPYDSGTFDRGGDTDAGRVFLDRGAPPHPDDVGSVRLEANERHRRGAAGRDETTHRKDGCSCW